MTNSVPFSTFPVKCLLIDDDVDDQEIFAMALADVSSSISCYFEGDGINAIQKLMRDDSFQPHCIFIDINMPRMNGVECLEQLRRIDRLKEIPVCMVSTTTDPSIVSQTRALGASDFIVKPASISVLSEQLRQFIAANVSLK
jgi:CheY-like chemotaxis protein